MPVLLVRIHTYIHIRFALPGVLDYFLTMTTDYRSRTRISMEGSMCAGHMKGGKGGKGLLVGNMGHSWAFFILSSSERKKPRENAKPIMKLEIFGIIGQRDAQTKITE